MIDMREAWDGIKEARLDHWREVSMHGMTGPCMYKQCLPSLTCMKTISTWHVHNLAGLFMVLHKRIVFGIGGVCSHRQARPSAGQEAFRPTAALEIAMHSGKHVNHTRGRMKLERAGESAGELEASDVLYY